MAIKLTTTRDSVKSIKVLVYGQAGAGKTCLSATTGGNALIISAEAGLLSLRDTDIAVAEVQSMDDLMEVYELLKNNHEDFKDFDWICIDSISEIAEVVLNKAKKDHKDPRQAYGVLSEQMQDLVRAFRDLPRNVYMSAKMEKQQDQDTGRMLYQPSAPGAKIGQALPYFFDEVFVLRIEKNPETGEMERMLQTQPDFNYQAKDRSGALDYYEPADLSIIANKILNTSNA